MNLKFSSVLILLLISLFSLGNGTGDSVYIDVSQIYTEKHLAKKAILIHDEEHELSPQAVVNGDYSSEKLIPVNNDVPYLDFTQSSYWMVLNIQNQSSIKHSYYLQLGRPLTNKLTLHLFDEANQKIVSIEAGDDLKFDERPIRSRHFIFPVSIPAQTKYKLVVEARSDGEILKMPMKFWTINTFTQFVTVENFFLGLYYGLFILVIVLFSFIGVALREKIYLFFVLYVFCLGIFQFSLDGLAYQYFWPDYPWIGNHAILIFAAFSMLFMLLYVQRFLEFSIMPKWYQRIYVFFITTVALCLGLSFTGGEPYALMFPILNGVSFIIIFFFIGGIIIRYRAGDQPGIPITLAFIFLCIGSILFIASNVNLIQNEFLASNALKFGSAAEVIFLSIAMASRYRKTQDEKIEAQEEAFRRLEEINKLKNEQTEKLEIQVAERTQEIVEKNDILSQQNKEIINSITYAKRLQDAILPSENAMIQWFKDSMVIYKPKDIVSGDFYWLEEADDKIFFAVADCTGHGVPGAMVSVLGHNSLNRCINEYGLRDAGKILDTLTELVEKTLSKNDHSVSDGMDIALCVWDKKDHLQFAGANNPLYLIRDGELIETKGDKQPIGKFISRVPFTSHDIKLKKGDSIYLFSDGYADQFGGPKGKKLKYAVFKRYIMELNQYKSEKIHQELSQRFEDWKGDMEQIDDVCVMQVHF